MLLVIHKSEKIYQQVDRKKGTYPPQPLREDD